MRLMPKGLIVCVVIMIVGAVVLSLTVLRVPATTRVTGTPNNPALGQWVVWDKTDPKAPAHYLNYGTVEGGYIAACGKQLPGMGGLTQFATIEQMEAEKRIPCGDCINVLQRYVDSMSARKRNDMSK